MEALRILKKVTDDRLDELKQFMGRNVEIIIFPDIPDKTKTKVHNLNLINELKGSLPDIQDGMEFQNKARQEWDR